MLHTNTEEKMTSNNRYPDDVVIPEIPKSQHEWAKLIDYPFRTLRDLEQSLKQTEEELEHIKHIARQFMDEANYVITGRVVKQGTYPGYKKNTIPYYLGYSTDKSFDVVKWRCKYKDDKGSILNNRRITALSGEMLFQSPAHLRDKMLYIERRRIELNYRSSLLGFKRNRLKRTLEQILSTSQLKKEQYR
ncbi:MAG: hypothetical protein KZQ92_19195 [Candidatus Thiodiazotropha sp. (ex Lucinoma borealis)]|nr:hypothetical protein [Candidatus Thiodiazotropha sp. (ex Lucinoma borealis)]